MSRVAQVQQGSQLTCCLTAACAQAQLGTPLALAAYVFDMRLQTAVSGDYAFVPSGQVGITQQWQFEARHVGSGRCGGWLLTA
jgi:hypothetical protein